MSSKKKKPHPLVRQLRLGKKYLGKQVNESAMPLSLTLCLVMASSMVLAKIHATQKIRYSKARIAHYESLIKKKERQLKMQEAQLKKAKAAAKAKEARKREAAKAKKAAENMPKVKKSYRVFAHDLSPEKLEAIIAKTRPKRDAARLAPKIIDVAETFKLDPFMFAALIHTESLFNPHAISRTGCVGLTQFCTPGVLEVAYQTGYSERIPDETVTYFQKTASVAAEKLGMEKFEHLWTKQSNVRRQKAYLKGQKGEDYALIYSAILLKSLLSAQAERKPWDNRRLWHAAAVRYNGDRAVKYYYANVILKKAARYTKSEG